MKKYVTVTLCISNRRRAIPTDHTQAVDQYYRPATTQPVYCHGLMPTIIHAYYLFQLLRRRHQARSAATNSSISQSKTLTYWLEILI